MRYLWRPFQVLFVARAARLLGPEGVVGRKGSNHVRSVATPAGSLLGQDVRRIRWGQVVCGLVAEDAEHVAPVGVALGQRSQRTLRMTGRTALLLLGQVNHLRLGGRRQLDHAVTEEALAFHVAFVRPA